MKTRQLGSVHWQIKGTCEDQTGEDQTGSAHWVIKGTGEDQTGSVPWD